MRVSVVLSVMTMVVIAIMGLLGANPSPAAAAGPGWSINSLAQPTNFQAEDAVGGIQNVYVNATGGTFMLEYEGEQTSPILYSASASEAQAALEALPSIGAGDVRVTGRPTGEVGVSRYVVSFVKALGPPAHAEQLVANGELLSGGTKTATVTPILSEDFYGDSYLLTVTNAGSGPTSGKVTITDTLPPGVTARKILFSNMETTLFPVTRSFEPEYQQEHGFSCTISPTIKCEFTRPMPSGDEVIIRIPVSVAESASSVVTNSATVEGGGVSSTVSTSEPATVPNLLNGTSPSTFGIQDFNAIAYGPNGEQDVQAGNHPYTLTTRYNLTSKVNDGGPTGQYEEGSPYSPIEEAKEVRVDLPLGLIGDPLAAPQCKETALTKREGETACPLASRVGTVDAELSGEVRSSLGAAALGPAAVNHGISAVYNMVPEKGYPAVFGFNFVGVGFLLYANVVHTSSGYDLQVKVPGLVRTTKPEGASLTFFGDPGQRNGGSTTQTAFFTNPVNCAAGPLTARIEANSWLHPSNWVVKETTAYPQITGCNMLQSEPEIEVKPETARADSPSGYEVDLKVPQTANVFPNLATPELKNATVTLPEGVSVAPSAADGLIGCEETGPEGIEIPQGEQQGSLLEPGEEIGPDGLPRLAPGHCPAASQIGTVEISTPVLASPLKGHVYLAQPKCGGTGQPACSEASATNGELFGIYLEAEGSGVIVKLKGNVQVNPQTGRVTTIFQESPQLPFSELKLRLNGGPRAPLANPQTCGQATTTSSLEPWSAPESGPATTPFSSFGVSGCSGLMGFSPSFLAQTESPLAGAFSPFTLTFGRHDGEQDLSGITVQTPPGLLGKIAGVPECSEAQANAGTCGPESQIGTTTVASGSGSEPLYLGGRVYLTGPYAGAPFGLSIVVPAVAGPFNLGNVVVRAAISINPVTAAITAISNPLPQLIDGVPTRLQTVNVTLNRPGFMFNPTNCDPQAVTATVTSAQGTSADVSAPFTAAGCKNLPFAPKFSASTAGRTSKALGASLDVKITSAGLGQANIAKVDVEIPKALPTQLKTLNHACTEAQFNANPANCPPASDIARVTVHTPLLNVPLKGPAYLVSHGNEAFPDVEMVVQGEGVELVIDGHTQIKKGVTYSHFETVPDAPFTSFEFDSPQGELALFTAEGNLCDQKLVMPVTLTGQNGAVLEQDNPIEVTGCSSSLAVVSSKVERKTLTLAVYAPGAGKVTARGGGVSSGSKSYGGREALTFTLKQRKGGRLKTKIKLTYTPSKGKKQTKTIKVRFTR